MSKAFQEFGFAPLELGHLRTEEIERSANCRWVVTPAHDGNPVIDPCSRFSSSPSSTIMLGGGGIGHVG